MGLRNTPSIIGDNIIYVPMIDKPKTSSNNFWAKVFDIHYERIPDADGATSDTSVWKNSYDGKHFSKEEMDDWLNNATFKIKKLILPESRVLEVGCGNGLILSQIIDDIKSYSGADLSDGALSSIANSILGKTHSDKINLYHLPADSVDTIDGQFDLIIVNSVAQYFPDLNYFFDFLEKCESKLSSNGAIFFGDIRSLELADQLYKDIARFKFPNDPAKAESLALRAKSRESETLYSPALFEHLQSVFHWIGSTEITDKVTKFKNEMSQFRYDVVLKSGEREVTDTRPFVLEKISNHLSISKEIKNINNNDLVMTSLHPKLFKLAQLYDQIEE